MAAALGRNDIVSLLVKAGAALDLQDQVLHEYPFTFSTGRVPYAIMLLISMLIEHYIAL